MEFQQRREFRRDNVYDSKSCSSSEPAHKKHKLISNLVSLENDEAINNCSAQQNGEHNLHVESPNSFGKWRKVHIENSKMDSFADKESKKNSSKRISRKKGKPGVCEAAALDDLKVFMKSLLEELKVTREDLFTWMKEEIKKLETDNIDSQPEKSKATYKGKSVDVLDNLEKNIPVHHRNNLEEHIIVQNQNGFFEKDSFMQHQNSDNEKNLKETCKARHWNSMEENIQLQHQSNFKLAMNSGLLERLTKSNDEASFDNCYQTLEDLAC